MAALELDAPAKLNLMLHVTGRRADGYHLLETVFQFIDLCDRVHLEVTGDAEVVRLPGGTPVAAADDLALAAAQALKRAAGVTRGARIAIEKRIPIGGGLGGGSSDAAACLLGLNRLWALDWSLERLAEIGVGLGADVPVFVHGRAAFAGGIGERLQVIDLAEPFYVVVDPRVAVSSAEIFAAQELTRSCDPITIRAFLDGAGTNVCEAVVRHRYPEVGAALDWLDAFAPARMSGTGSCVFAAFDSLDAAKEVKSRAPAPWVAQVAAGINRSPVHRQLELSR